MYWKMLVLVALVLALPAFGQNIVGDAEATPWEPTGKNQWQAFIPGKNYSRAEMTLANGVVSFRIVQKCKPDEKVGETTLEWNAGDEVGIRRDCAGRVGKHAGMPKYLEENVFKAYPPEVQKVLRSKRKAHPPIPMEELHRVKPMHEVRRASAPGFSFYKSKRAARRSGGP